jgi:hypothetical protein
MVEIKGYLVFGLCSPFSIPNKACFRNWIIFPQVREATTQLDPTESALSRRFN